MFSQNLYNHWKKVTNHCEIEPKLCFQELEPEVPKPNSSSFLEPFQRCLLCISPGTTLKMDISTGSPYVNINFLPVLLSGPSPRCSLFFCLCSWKWDGGFPLPWHSLAIPYTQPFCPGASFTSFSWIKIFSKVVKGISKILWKSPLTVPTFPGNPDKGVCS